MTTKSIVFLIGFPIYIVIGTVYCCVLIGYWGLLSVGTFIACFVIQNYMGRFIASFRKKCVQYSDQRVRRMGEIINNIKFIKMYGWENPFMDTIKGERRLESKHLLNVAFLTGIIISLVPVTPTIASVVTITAYAASGNALTASTVFSVIGTMNFLREIFARIPLSLKAFAEAKVSMERIQSLLLMDEYSTPSAHVSSTDTAVEIYDADFVWDLSTSSFNYNTTLSEEAQTHESNRKNGSEKVELLKISFVAKKGTLIGICGAVGAGKSALMSAILGRMDKTRGHLAVNGNVAYVAQQAWIFNGSLKENILFGEELDLKRFNEIIRCCCLWTDISALPDGVDTEIGERGTNLSGGQKQRVSLARAIYSNRDIYILDDPFSALDAKIGKHIFKDCIKGLLKTKTILLVTHHIQYLKYCDEVVVMDERAITQRGQHNELLRQTGLYSDLFKMFGSHNKDMSEGVIAPTDKDDANHCTCINDMEKSMHETKRNFIEPEHCAVGSIGVDTYCTYIRAAGGWCIGLVVVGLHMVSSASIIFADWWISKWINAHDFVRNSENTTTTISSTNWSMHMNITRSNSDMSAINVVSHAQDVFSFIRYDTYLVVYATSLVGIFVVQLIKSFVEAKVALKASDSLHDRCIKSVMKASLLFFDSNPSGRILNRFSRDLDELDVYLVQTTQELLYCLTMTFLSMAMSAYVTPWLLTSVIPIALLFCVLRQVSSVSIRQLKRFENVARSPLISEVGTTASGLTTIVTYGQQERFTGRCFRAGDTASISLFLFDVGVRWVVIRLDLITGVLAVSATFLFVFNKGVIPPATAGLVLGLFGKTISIIQLLIKLTNNAEAHFTAVERMREYDSDIELEPHDVIDVANDEWPQSGKIEFKDVVMRYRRNLEPVLRRVSFEINPGEKLGIVGRTGAGKSTLTTALFRLVEICGGSIMVDHVDISNLHLGAIRSKMTIITQTPVLFAGTIRYNIDPYYRCSDETIWSALHKVHMKQKVSQFQDGIDTVIEENGENFSVGERQLLCLARAIVRSCKILILDEATANVDISTDVMIQQTIQECFTDCTVMIIAHRLSTVLQCDKIIVMEEGQVVESGSTREIIANQDSQFTAMISAQVKSL